MVFTNTLSERAENAALKAPVDRNYSAACAECLEGEVVYYFNERRTSCEVEMETEKKKNFCHIPDFRKKWKWSPARRQHGGREKEKSTLEVKHYGTLNSAVSTCLWACMHLRSNTMHVAQLCWSACVTAGLERVNSYKPKPSASMSTLQAKQKSNKPQITHSDVGVPPHLIDIRIVNWS